jgi:hypothetical protein
LAAKGPAPSFKVRVEKTGDGGETEVVTKIVTEEVR